MDVYNPTLKEATIAMDTSGPSGWTISGNYDSVDLLPGTSSVYDISITPAKGEDYTPRDGKMVKVTASGSGIEETSITLEVKIPLIVDIRLSRSGTGPVNGEAGKEALANITVKNYGNREESINFTMESTDELEMGVSPDEIALAPGAEGQVGITISLPDKESDANYVVTLKASAGGKTTTLSMDLFAKGAGKKTDMGTVLIIAIVVGIVIVGLVGAFIYMRMGKKSSAEKGPSAPEPKAVPRPNPRPYIPPRPVAPPPDTELMRRADEMSRDMLDTKRVVEATEMD
jgi:uncharacterized membrane protein